jgi:uncharacterized protein YfaT (DUF1175 family)
VQEHAGLMRWLGMACVIAVAAYGVGIRRHPSSPGIAFTLSQATIPANGLASARLELRSLDHRPLKGLQLETSDVHRLRVEAVNVDGDHATAVLRSGVMPGSVGIEARLNDSAEAHAAIETILDDGDSAGDGTPDFLRLSDEADRQAFRRWFVFVAEAQFFAGPDLSPEVKDCAGLLRFAYREAARDHDGRWALKLHLPPIAADVPSIRQYSFPFTPLGASLFRVHAGRFRASDLGDDTFAEYADANTLRRYNTHFISRDLAMARPGDLLFFRQFGQDSPYHTMIFMGRSHFEDGPDAYVVYHTGPTRETAGEVRRSSIHDLLRHPDTRWHPAPENPAFLGVYRWNILRGAN